MPRLILIDSNALIHRAYHALPPLKTKKGVLVNAVYGFMSVLLKVLRELKPDYLAAAFDLAGPTFRELEYKEYKAKRVKPPQEMYDQIPLIKQILQSLNIPIYEKQGFEADDVIGTIASQISNPCPERSRRVKSQILILIVTGDLDALQLVDKNTKVYTLKKGIKDTMIYDERAVFERYGLKPEQIIDLKGLKGDPSDNIPGVPGVGEKTAIELLKKFDSLKNLYQQIEKVDINPKLKAKLLEYKDQAFFSQHLATIKRDVPIEFNLADCQWGRYDKEKVIKLFKELEFNSLIERVRAALYKLYKMRFSIPKRTILVLVFIFIGLALLWHYSHRTFEIESQTEPSIEDKKISPISGLSCQNYQRRPIAVILAEDPVARPLAGLREADLIFEMPVITGEMTRLMAIYICGSPTEIGSLRSARHDFIPLAMGLDAILAHWGGSHFALNKLNRGIMDNIDALRNPFDAFYRKPSLPKPHNGFTSMNRLIKAAEKLGYRLEGEFEGYAHRSPDESQVKNKKTLKIGYPYPYNIKYQYNPQTNSYLRWRGGKPELDRNDGFQIEAKNIVIMRAASRQIYDQYNDVDVEGSGDCQVYQNGQVISGTWQKSKSDPASKLYFLDQTGQEIPFVPGQIWIEIIEPEKKISWE